MAEPCKKLKPDEAVGASTSEASTWKIETPFEKGTVPDEVELRFDNDKSLFVSKSFLMYSSPVFDRMFQSDFRESRNNLVEMKGKDFDIFQEMLLHLHPGIRKPIADNRAITIYEFANEYQMPTVKAACLEALDKYVKALRLCDRSISFYTVEMEKAFTILAWADLHKNATILKTAIDNISRLPVYIFKSSPKWGNISDTTKISLLLFRAKRGDKQHSFIDYDNY